MLAKPRPQSAIRRPMTAIPKQMTEEPQNLVSTPRNRKSTLTNLIPDMPAVIVKNHASTALLYSKFIMKGIQTNKLDLVRESFNMKKQSLKHDKKMSLKLMKTIKSTKESCNQPLKSNRNDPNSRAQFLLNSQLNADDTKMFNLEINNFFRINSNRKTLQQNQTQRKLSNVQSQKGFRPRPQSALNTPHQIPRNTRAQTANYKKVPTSYNRQSMADYDDFKALIPERNLLTIRQSDMPGVKYTNFLQRNKCQLSANSKKTSIYLTGIDSNKGEKQIKKIPAKKHRNKKSMPDLHQFSEFDFVRNEPLLSEKQKAEIENKSKQNSEFMKKNMPHQFKKYVQQIAIQQNNGKSIQNQLISINLEQNPNQFGQINLNCKNQNEAMEQANDYFNQYAHICEQTEYYINKHLKKKQIPKSFNQVLHVGDCQELLQLQSERKTLEAKANTPQQLKEIKQRMFSILKVLSFFKSKSAEVCYKIFSLSFSIFTCEEDQTIIQRGDQIKSFYVILNGSVIRESKNQPKEDSYNPNNQKARTQTQVYTNTLFDGETFGEPDNQSEPTYRHQYKAAEKVLLMCFSYFDYKKICSESQKIQERIDLLKDIFGSVPGCKSLTNENLEALAFELEAFSFDAKQVIFRKDDICEKLIIVSSGQVAKVNEHILKRAKKNSKDMKKKNKSSSKLKLKNHSIQKLRRSNLKNYEVLNQNEEQFIFYYQDIAKEFIKGDVTNWQGFSYLNRKTAMDQEQPLSERQNPNPINSMSPVQYRLEHSLISNSDNTKIYTLTMNRIQHLPQMLKEVIYAKIDDAMKKEKQRAKSKLQKMKEKLSQPKTATCIDKWDEYKQKICNDILSRKLKV